MVKAHCGLWERADGRLAEWDATRLVAYGLRLA